MLLLVGLGNPGAEYAGHRHNIGFMALDAIRTLHRGAPWRRKFQGEASEIALGERRAILIKPQTFMNESGRAVAEAMRFYRIALADVFVLHDELDLPPGKVRLKRGGGNAGHNGLRSISAHCGNDFARVRIGIGHPGDKALVHRHVLSDFAKSERAWVEDLCAAIAANAAALVAKDESLFGTKVHLAMVERGHLKAESEAAPPKKTGLAGEPR